VETIKTEGTKYVNMIDDIKSRKARLPVREAPKYPLVPAGYIDFLKTNELEIDALITSEMEGIYRGVVIE
jgi:hypothetical protein